MAFDTDPHEQDPMLVVIEATWDRMSPSCKHQRTNIFTGAKVVTRCNNFQNKDRDHGCSVVHCPLIKEVAK